MKFQEDFELRVKVFRKMGWEQNSTPTHTSFWWEDEDLNRLDELPPIETSWEVCAERLVPFMRRKGFYYYITSATNLWGLSFVWCNSSGAKIIDCEQEITNDNIPRAACGAFLEVEL